MEWVTVALSGGSVCVGAGLTMLGQYLADRRSQIRDREARREGFRIANYEIQRDALLELQELVIKLSGNVSSISMSGRFQDIIPPKFNEVTQWYQISPLMSELAQEWSDGFKLVEEADQIDLLTEERKIAIASRLRKMAENFAEMSKKIEPARRYFGEVADASNRIRMLSARTGSDAVLAYSRNLLKALDKWATAETFDESDRQGKNVKREIEAMLDVISDALRSGPLS
jgi:hypothetical protein